MTTTPPDRVDTIVDERVKRCLADANPLNALLRILDAVSMESRLTDFEFEEVKRRSVRRIVEARREADNDGWMTFSRSFRLVVMAESDFVDLPRFLTG